jgi:hypothetical protein
VEKKVQQQQAILASMRETGFAMLDPLAEITAMNAFLRSRPVYVDAHVPQTARNRGEDARFDRENRRAVVSECVCVHTDDAIVAPGWIERALDLTPIAAAYLSVTIPVAYSANFFWTRPGPAALRGDIQDFHRDADDSMFVGMFVYLTDVLSDADGPHELEGPDGVVRAIFGPAGTMFMADTSFPHRGRKPTSGERGFGWWRWGVSDRPPANEWDEIRPVPVAALSGRLPLDARKLESLRLLVTA